MKFKVLNLGCKVNTYESTYIEETFLKNGYIEASSLDDANIIVVNTCSVTNMADQKSKKMLRRIKRENPKAIIIACGCSVQNKIDDYKNLDIDILIGNDNKSKVLDYVKDYLINKNKIIDYNESRNKKFDSMILDKFKKHTRAFIKIEDGCDNFCSYCVIPLLRGTVRCKDFDESIKEAKMLAENGHKEIVLVGIHTGRYESNGKDLTDLINEISKIDKIVRIRLSSIEITELNDKFLDMLKTNKKLVDHLHIPLQAGSDEILKLMNRKYDLDYYFNKINTIRSIRPNINITTDVIVGHPYETKELFNKTIETCNKIKFGKIHVFPYSKRDNTVAASMNNQVSEEEKKIRSNILCKLSEDLEIEYQSKYLNQELEIITEINNKNEIVGFTNNYIKVLIENKENLTNNMLVKVKLLNIKDGYVISKLL